MNPLIIDIETQPNPHLVEFFKETYPAVAEEDIRKKMATDTDFCEIVCIGLKRIDGQSRILDSIEDLNSEAWYNALVQSPIVSFNGKRFDIPIIIKHGIKKGLKLPYKRLHDACKPWGYGDRHLDLMETLAFGRDWKSLDTYLQLYCSVAKHTKGAEFFETATKEEIKTHCIEDLEYTEQLYKTFEPML